NKKDRGMAKPKIKEKTRGIFLFIDIEIIMHGKIRPIVGFLVAFLISTGRTSLFASPSSAFFIFSEGTNLNQNIQRLEKSGALVRHVVPPRILIVDLGSTGA